MKKALKILGLLVVLLALFLTVLILAFGRDIPAPDLSDLEPERIRVADEDNARTWFIGTTNVVYMPANAKSLLSAFQKGEAIDEAAVAEIIAKNSDTFAGILRGLECKQCIHPIRRADEDDPAPPHWLRIGELLAAKTRLERTSGAFSNAVQTCGVQLLFAERIGEYPSDLLDCLISIVVRKLALKQARDLARDTHSTPADLGRLSAILSGRKPVSPSLVRALKGEIQHTIQFLDKVRAGTVTKDDCPGVDEKDFRAMKLGFKWLPTLLFKPNETQKLFAGAFRSLIADTSQNYGGMEIHKHLKEQEVNRGTLLQVNAVGKILLAVALPAYASSLHDKCFVEADLASTRIIVACHRYRLREGRFPEELENLIPAFLEAVPMDPFDGKPFRYDSERAITWSVGKDLLDSRGSTNSGVQGKKDRRYALDAVYQIDGEEGY